MPTGFFTNKAELEDELLRIQLMGQAFNHGTAVPQQEAQVCRQVVWSCNSFSPNAMEEVLRPSAIRSQQPHSQIEVGKKSQGQRAETGKAEVKEKISEQTAFRSIEKFCSATKLNSSVIYLFFLFFFQVNPSAILDCFASGLASLETLCLGAYFLHESKYFTNRTYIISVLNKHTMNLYLPCC